MLPRVDFEVRKRTKSTEPNAKIETAVRRYIEKTGYTEAIGETIKGDKVTSVELKEFLLHNIAEFTACDETPCSKEEFEIGDIFIFALSRMTPEEETLENENEDIAACQIWTLPSKDFHGQWEALHMEPDVKRNLLHFSRSSMFFAERGVADHLISWNKVILLHGPPGTGKTSLCKALAHKLAIRQVPAKYSGAMLLEINAHSLFSKYFSESGKLVMKMFARIKEYLEDRRSFVVILIDEVESLTAARSASKDEPSDAIRVVNSLLTQLDQLKRFPNALVMTTSNVTGKIDLAFVDRADMKVHIGLPGKEAIYEIFLSSIMELQRTAIVERRGVMRPIREIIAREDFTRAESQLLELAQLAQGLSGRALRKLPFLAHVKFIQSTTGQIPLQKYMESMHQAIQSELADRADLQKEVKL